MRRHVLDIMGRRPRKQGIYPAAVTDDFVTLVTRVLPLSSGSRWSISSIRALWERVKLVLDESGTNDGLDDKAKARLTNLHVRCNAHECKDKVGHARLQELYDACEEQGKEAVEVSSQWYPESNITLMRMSIR